MKTIIIVGGSSGIGLRAAAQLIEQGYNVYNLSRNECTARGVKNLTVDASKAGAIKSTVQTILNENYSITHAIYCSGCSVTGSVENVSQEEYRYLFDVNFFGAVEMAKAVIPSMRVKKQGSLIFVGSVASETLIPFETYYTASKAALQTFSSTLNFELKPLGITSSCVMPGGTATPFSRKRKIVDESDCYSKPLDNLIEELNKVETEGADADKVAASIVKLVNSKKPAPKVVTGLNNKLYVMTEKFLPEQISYYFSRKKFKLDNTLND